MPDIKLYFLQSSRAIRTAWLLEELQLPYTFEFANRENGRAPAFFKEAIIRAGNPLGKSPTIVDNGLVIGESGTITE
jgi:glutathione S-transferase